MCSASSIFLRLYVAVDVDITISDLRRTSEATTFNVTELASGLALSSIWISDMRIANITASYDRLTNQKSLWEIVHLRPLT